MMDVVVTTGDLRRAKLRSIRHLHQTKTQLYTGQIPFRSHSPQCETTEGNFTISSHMN